MKIRVTQVMGDGTVRRALVDTAERDDAERWEELARRANLSYPPAYRAEPGQPVYEVEVDGDVAQLGEGNLVGPLRELVTAVLAESERLG